MRKSRCGKYRCQNNNNEKTKNFMHEVFSYYELSPHQPSPETQNHANENPAGASSSGGVKSQVLLVYSEIQHQPLRVFEAFFDTDEEGDRFLAVDDAVVVAQSQIHHRADGDLTADDHWTFLDLVHAENA